MIQPNAEPVKSSFNRLIPTAAVLATLAVTGCANQDQAQETTPLKPDEITLTAAKLPQGECSLHYVRPNAFLRHQKNALLSKDLGLLSVLTNETKKAKFGDIATASSIIYDSYRDPVYAQAITKANQSIRRGKRVTAKQLKTTKTDKLTYCEDKNHISKKDARNQYHRTTAIGQYLIRGLGKKYAKQGSLLAERTLDKVDETFNELSNRLNEASK